MRNNGVSRFNSPADETLFTVDDWPMRLEDTREQLKKAQTLLERYRIALRLARAEIERRNQGVMTLTTFAYQASCAGNRATVLKLALTQALDFTSAPVGAIVLVDSETEQLSLGVHKGLTAELCNVLTGQQLGAGARALMPHLVTGSGALLEYASSSDQREHLLLTAGRVTSLVSLPLLVGSRLVGALLVGLQGARRFKPAELRFLMAISQETAVALECVGLRKELWHTVESLLDGRIISEDVQTVEQSELKLETLPLLSGLPEPPSMITQPVEEDLEQLLTAMMETEAEVRQQNADLQTLNAIAEMLNCTLDLKDILQCTVDQTRAVLKTDAAWIYLVGEGNRLVMRAHAGLSSEYVHGMRRLKPNDGLEGRVAAKNEALSVESVSEDAHTYKIWVEREGLSALLAVPITRPEHKGQSGQVDSQTVGVLATGKHGAQEYRWRHREVRLLISIANQVALAIDNARLYARVQEDEAGLRAGHHVLREINDMLLAKNAFLEDFIQDNLVPALSVSNLVLRHLQAPGEEILTNTEAQEYAATLRTIVSRMRELSEEVGVSSDAARDSLHHATGGEDQKQDSGNGIRVADSDASGQPASELMNLEEAVAAGLVPLRIVSR